MGNKNLTILIVIVLCMVIGVTAYILTDSNMFNQNQKDNESFNNSGEVNVSEASVKKDNKSSNNSKRSDSESHDGMTKDQAKKIATDHISEDGAYAGDPYWDQESNLWIVPIYDKNNKKVDAMGVDPKTGKTSKV
jgi:cytoskeletal protein RodZ